MREYGRRVTHPGNAEAEFDWDPPPLLNDRDRHATLRAECRDIGKAGVLGLAGNDLLVASCEAGVAHEDDPPLPAELVRLAQLVGGRPATGDPRRTTASLIPCAIDLAIGLATVRALGSERLAGGADDRSNRVAPCKWR
jgi:hypothetical protein